MCNSRGSSYEKTGAKRLLAKGTEWVLRKRNNRAKNEHWKQCDKKRELRRGGEYILAGVVAFGTSRAMHNSQCTTHNEEE